eukprot:m.43335 g.43335  ORF g.43335 m.43335 type:complete len:938 (-) comp10767_c0_seq1:109-2922(-)
MAEKLAQPPSSAFLASLLRNVKECIEVVHTKERAGSESTLTPAAAQAHTFWHECGASAADCLFCTPTLHAVDDIQDSARVHWAYCATGLQMFLLAHFRLVASKRSETGEAAGLLSMADTKHLRLVFEFLIALGLQPLLHKGVGVPLGERVGHRATVSGLMEPAKKPLGSVLVYLRVLVECCGSPPLRELIFEKNLADLLGACLQEIEAATSVDLSSSEACGHQQESTVLPAPSVASAKNSAHMGGAELFTVLQELATPQSMIEALMLLSGRRCSDAPPWLRRACFVHMTRTIAQPGGVLALMAVLLRVALLMEESPAHMAVAVLWQQCQRTAIMLAASPAPGLPSVDAFYALVCPQVLQVLRTPPGRQTHPLVCAAAATVLAMGARRPDLAESLLFANLCKSLRQIQACNSQDPPADCTLPDESAIDACVRDLHRLFIANAPPGQGETMMLIHDDMIVIFYLFCAAARCRSHLRAALEDLVVTFLKTAPAETVTRDLVGWLDRTCYVTFSLGQSGGLLAGPRASRPDDKDFASSLDAMLEADGRAAAALVTQLGRDDVFVSLVSSLILSFGARSLFGEHANGVPPSLSVHTLLFLLEDSAPVFARKPAQSLPLLMTMLRDESSALRVSALSLLDGIISEPEHRPPMADLLPFIPVVTALASGPQPEVAAIAEHLKSSLTVSTSESTDSTRSTSAQLNDIMTQLGDSLLPVRAHAILKLQALIQQKDRLIVSLVPELIDLFLLQLRDPDSYVYLTAVDGLVTLINCNAPLVLPPVLSIFASGEQRLETRLKIGEVLLRGVRALGELLPKFSGLLLATTLPACKDRDALVRSSALSILAEFAAHSQFAFSPDLHEILACAVAVVAHDPTPEARRAAVRIIAAAATGLRTETLATLGPALGPARSRLALVEASDPDDMTRFHARSALKLLDETVFSLQNQ